MLTNFITKHKLAALFLIVVLGFCLRLRGLGNIGFNEDEVHKAVAARSYLRGQFSVNLEHPMLMKSLAAMSVGAADAWNREHLGSQRIQEETAVRLPNLIFGALTAVVIFLLAYELFGTGVALVSSLLWATGTIAITVNRVAKEDTLLVFFTWLGYYLYLRAKNLSTTDKKRATRFYGASGVSFGLMLAAKYFPHYLGLNALYYILCDRGKPGRPLGKRNTLLFLGACATAFILVNPVILLPSTLKYIIGYVCGSSITHHGYLMMGHLYREDVAGAGGMPKYFYLLLLAIKTPIPILAGLVVGLVEIWKRRRERAFSFVIFMFIFWIVPFSLVGSKWLRYMLAWMPAVYIIAAIGLVRLWTWLCALPDLRAKSRLAPALAAAFVLVFVVYPVGVAVHIGPYYSLYLNALGLGRTGYYFPHDEMNDMGLRAAAGHISEEAPYGASVGSEGGPVFQYYFHKYGRDDLQYFDLSDQAKRLSAPDSAFLVLQDGRIYFENAAFVRSLQSRQLPIRRVEIGGADAARIYRNQEVAELRSGQ
jgi:Dolichyl-phosphate-mannose-protein mannosyltransferase